MIGCLRTRVRKQPITAFYFDSDNELKFYNLEASSLPVFNKCTNVQTLVQTTVKSKTEVSMMYISPAEFGRILGGPGT